MIDVFAGSLIDSFKLLYKTLYKAFSNKDLYDWDLIYKEVGLCNKSKLYPILVDSNQKDEVKTYLFSIPYGLSINDFRKHKDKISQFLKVSDNSLKIDLRNNLAIISVYNTSLIRYDYEDYNFNNKEFKIPIGIDLDTFKTVYWKPTDPSQAHLLIGGSTGGGKSVTLNVILSHIIKNRKDVQLYLQDTKLVDLYCFKDAKQVKYYGEGKKGIEETIQKLNKEMNNRYIQIRKAGCKDINSYRRIRRLPYIFLVIEELASFNPKDNKDFYNSLADLLAKGRASGIYVIITTQAPYSQILPGMLKNNINTIIGLKTKTKEASKVVCGIEEALVNLRGKGHGKIFLPDGMMEIQCFNISECTIGDIVNDSK